MGTFEELTTNIFPNAVKAGSFGADVTKFVSFNVQNQKGSDQFASGVVFGDVALENSAGERTVQPVVIKTHRQSDFWGIKSSLLFHNEVLFYSKIIPALQKYDKNGFLSTCFSGFVYGKATNGAHPEEDMVILKNLSEKGFKMSEARLHLDEKHIILALNRLANFHALSLAFQMDDPKGFNQLISQFKRIPVVDVVLNIMSEEMFANILQRGVASLKNDPKYQDRMSDLCANLDIAIGHWRKYLLASEPLTVISHGDFNRNNVMFKYGANGDPVEVAFFDFQTIEVSSPAVDVTRLLFMNVTPEDRNLHWDQFLNTYYGAMSRQLDGYPKKPSFEAVELSLRKHGIIGYYMYSIVIPMMVSHIGGPDVPGSDIHWENSDYEHVKESMQNFCRLEVGGSKATHLLVGIVKHMIDKNYIFKH